MRVVYTCSRTYMDFETRIVHHQFSGVLRFAADNVHLLNDSEFSLALAYMNVARADLIKLWDYTIPEDKRPITSMVYSAMKADLTVLCDYMGIEMHEARMYIESVTGTKVRDLEIAMERL